MFLQHIRPLYGITLKLIRRMTCMKFKKQLSTNQLTNLKLKYRRAGFPISFLR